MDEIVKTLIEALVLVILVVFIFLQGWRATLIPFWPSRSRLIGTFVFFPLFGFSINTLSLFGLVLAIGLVVDDAIVVVEAVEHHIEKGLIPARAPPAGDARSNRAGDRHRARARRGLHPDRFLPGITGRLYQQFAVTIAISVILSAFNALTLSPALSALLLRPRKQNARPARLVLRLVQQVFGRTNEWAM